ncbi:hypothetical protein Trihar35433_8641 [Trichoderma harzianum]|nr:hypothetical protein Trihar35433_8641 [Trichoderma harzianum]
MGFNNIAIAGGSGNLGLAILRELLSSSDPVFNVTALTHSKSTTAASLVMALGLSSTASNHLKIIWVDYNNEDNLMRALSGAEVVIATLAGHVALQINPLLLKAARKAGVRRYIPSQYALDVLHPKAVELFTDGWPNAFPVALARRYEALAEENGPISYTTVLPSMFIDVFLETGLWGAYDIPNRRVVVVDDGTRFLTGCSTEFIAAAITAILKLPEDATENKRIPIAEIRTTQSVISSAEGMLAIPSDSSLSQSGDLQDRSPEPLIGHESACSIVLEALNNDETEALLQKFQQKFVPIFPFAAISIYKGSYQIRHLNPFLFLCIMAVTIGPKHPFRAHVQHEVMNQGIRRMMLGLERNLDLLRGFLVLASWCHLFPFSNSSRPDVLNLI